MNNNNKKEKIIKKTHKLKNPRLRRIRYNIRVILWLERNKRLEKFMSRRKDLNDKRAKGEVSPKEWIKEVSKIQNDEMRYVSKTLQYPATGCFVCDSRFNDLELREDNHWYCLEGNHDPFKNGKFIHRSPFK
ncbi:MAG: hypothetical protein BAJALOKI2v1_650023 [Promethearchaeota archaeon]|nr:MAG: hypothetical protein BAJALOKI2v1_650023 [Candidatus Lokiarchaeota archaeon]